MKRNGVVAYAVAWRINVVSSGVFLYGLIGRSHGCFVGRKVGPFIACFFVCSMVSRIA